MGTESLPHELPGMITYREPRTLMARALAAMLLPWMVPTDEFPQAKCRQLRLAMVPHLERIEEKNPRSMACILEAAELDVKDVDAYRKALDVSEADAAALWAARPKGAALAYREFLVAAALRRCSS